MTFDPWRPRNEALRGRCSRRHVIRPEPGEQNGAEWFCLRDPGHDGPCRPYAERTSP